MPVYLTPLRRRTDERCSPAGNFFTHLSTMTADTLEELHLMAFRLGLGREWCEVMPRQHDCHYHLTPRMQGQALQEGAAELSPGQRLAHQRKSRLIAPQLHLEARRAS